MLRVVSRLHRNNHHIARPNGDAQAQIREQTHELQMVEWLTICGSTNESNLNSETAITDPTYAV